MHIHTYACAPYVLAPTHTCTHASNSHFSRGHRTICSHAEGAEKQQGARVQLTERMQPSARPTNLQQRDRENSKHRLEPPRFPLPSLRPGQDVHPQKGLVSTTCSSSGARVPHRSSAAQKHHSQNHALKWKGGARLSGCHGNSSFSTTEVKRIGNSGVV